MCLFLGSCLLHKYPTGCKFLSNFSNTFFGKTFSTSPNEFKKNFFFFVTEQLTVKEAQLKTALEEKELAKLDLTKTGDQDEAVKEARCARDAAITRKGEVEVQLARARIEVLQANSQLIEAVQQKIELSQQLEQWQVSRSLIPQNT